MPTLLLFFVVVAVIAGISIYGAMQVDRRRKDLAAWAHDNGLRFTDTNDYGMANRFPDFTCLRRGEDRYAYNVIRGVWNQRAIHAFDYHYETYTTHKGRRQTHHHHFSAVIVTSDVPLKPLLIRPERIFDKIAEFVGFSDINYESAEFSRRYHVSAPDKRWAYDVLHARTIEFLLQQPDCQLEFDHHHILAQRNRRYSLPEIIAAATVIHGVLDRLPEYLVKQQRGET